MSDYKLVWEDGDSNIVTADTEEEATLIADSYLRTYLLEDIILLEDKVGCGDKIMTELESLEKTLLIWRWLKNHLGETKKQAYLVLGLDKDTSDCPLCEYVDSNFKDKGAYRCKDCCPLGGKWLPHITEPCWFGKNYYAKWSEHLSEYLSIVLETVGDLSPSQERRIIVLKCILEINSAYIIAMCNERIKEIQKDVL